MTPDDKLQQISELVDQAIDWPMSPQATRLEALYLIRSILDAE